MNIELFAGSVFELAAAITDLTNEFEAKMAAILAKKYTVALTKI